MTYSTECEEMAYSKDSAALRAEADMSFDQTTPGAQNAAERWTGDVAIWFSWWTDTSIGLVFDCGEDQALERIRALPDRPEREMG